MVEDGLHGGMEVADHGGGEGASELEEDDGSHRAGTAINQIAFTSLQDIFGYVSSESVIGKSSKVFCVFVHWMLPALSYSVNTCTIMIPISPSAPSQPAQ